MMKTAFRIITLLSLIILLTSSVAAADETSRRASGINTIVIDPGHGGDDDPGAVGPTGLQERELTLAIALKLRNLIVSDPTLSAAGVKVVLTRDRDKLMQLEERAAIANNAAGDLFISIHANGFRLRSVRGAETYFLSLKASDEHARMVAEIENQGFEAEVENGGASSEDEGLKLVLFDFIHKQYLAESKFLAEHIQAEFNSSINNGDRGIRQSPLRVLKGVAMPAVLVEVDYLTNPAREQLLRSEEYQQRFAASMLKAIKEYKQLKERGLAREPVNEETSSGNSPQ